MPDHFAKKAVIDVVDCCVGLFLLCSLTLCVCCVSECKSLIICCAPLCINSEKHFFKDTPRSLYRKKRKEKGLETWLIDERALGRRRRLSSGDSNAARPRNFTQLIRSMKAQRRSNHEKQPSSLETSRLLSLPVEIRVLIWQYAVGNRTVHIFYGKPVKNQPYQFPLKATVLPMRIRHKHDSEMIMKRLSCLSCSERPLAMSGDLPYPRNLGCEECGTAWDSRGKCIDHWLEASSEITEPIREVMMQQVTKKSWKPLALLQTCRKIYTESVALMYATNTFHFAHALQVRHFAITLLPQRLGLVTRVTYRLIIEHLIFSAAIDHLIEQYPALKYVDIEVFLGGNGTLHRPDRTELGALVRLADTIQARDSKGKVVVRDGLWKDAHRACDGWLEPLTVVRGLEIVTPSYEERPFHSDWEWLLGTKRL